ncbi:MAG: hypothetical protein K8L99_06180 [Anaerolineae bacterium]|nr:hypothetical protein [Anaerolineae bacterium]
MHKKLALLLVLVNLSACQGHINQIVTTQNIETQTATAIHPTATVVREDWTEHKSRTVSLAIKIPAGWTSYNTDAGIVLNERAALISDAVSLQGILVHIFAMSVEKFHLPQRSNVNIAWSVLSQIVTNPDYVGNALVSEPVAFEWDHHDAAYYLLNNLDGTVTVLLAMELPNNKNLVVCHISSPIDEADHVRDLLPELFSSLRVNGTLVDSSALDELPDPLVFPLVSTTSVLR